MPKARAAFKVANLVLCEGAKPRLSRQENQHSDADQHVQQVNTGEHEVVHEEVAAVQRDTGTELRAVLKYFDDDEAEAASQRQQQAVRRHLSKVLTRGLYPEGNEPGTGQHQGGIERTQILIQKCLGAREGFDRLAAVVQECDEEQRKDQHVAKHKNPDALFSGHVSHRSRRRPSGRFSAFRKFF